MGLPNAKVPLHQGTQTVLLAAASLHVSVLSEFSLHPNILKMSLLCN